MAPARSETGSGIEASGFVAIDPSTGSLIARWTAASPAEIAAALQAADRAQRAWAGVPIAARAELLRRLADRARAEAHTLADLAAAEMGKPRAEGLAEVEKCALACEHYAEHAAAYLADEPVATDAGDSFVTYCPLGVILAIMPWNFPFWQVFRCAVPAVAAGNAVILKHAPNVPGCAEAIAGLWSGAGAPDGLFSSLRADVADVPGILAHPAVRSVSFTGSPRAGAEVAAAAGARLKTSVLELGGSDAALVLEDADLDLAVEQCARGRMINGGQSCIAAKRLIVVGDEARRSAFTERLTARLAAVVMGDPRDPATELGPLAREDLRAALHAQVVASVEAGARVRLGGVVPDGPGWFYPPTVLTEVVPGMPVFDEETFGPVAAVVAAADEAAAVALANASRFGLGASIFTADAARGERIAAEQLEAGSVFVNGFVRSDPRLPFGGIKDSGWGRELGRHGLIEFTNVKTVWVAGAKAKAKG